MLLYRGSLQGQNTSVIVSCLQRDKTRTSLPLTQSVELSKKKRMNLSAQVSRVTVNKDIVSRAETYFSSDVMPYLSILLIYRLVLIVNILIIFLYRL